MVPDKRRDGDDRVVDDIVAEPEPQVLKPAIRFAIVLGLGVRKPARVPRTYEGRGQSQGHLVGEAVGHVEKQVVGLDLSAVDPSSTGKKVVVREQVLVQNGHRPFTLWGQPGLGSCVCRAEPAEDCPADNEETAVRHDGDRQCPGVDRLSGRCGGEGRLLPELHQAVDGDERLVLVHLGAEQLLVVSLHFIDQRLARLVQEGKHSRLRRDACSSALSFAASL